VTGALAAGWPAQAPYDAILVEGATEIVPATLIKQLKPGGRLACVMGRGPGKATIYRRSETDISGRAVFDAAAPLLPGFAKPQEFVF
jgi:protein-L-isoaspartate(D-aspartate) O-methyltransferase